MSTPHHCGSSIGAINTVQLGWALELQHLGVLLKHQLA